MRDYKIWDDSELEIIRNNYTSVRVSDMLKLLPGRTEKAIFAKANHLGINGTYGKRTYTYNLNYFSNLSTESAYWAGFIAADGCITRDSRNRTNLVFTLNKKDEGQLKLFVKSVNYTGCILNIDRCNARSVKLNGAGQMANDLYNYYNITCAKSLTLQPPNITDPDLIKAFIVGYIDGDGCISVNSRGLTIEIAGTLDIVTWIKDQFYLMLPAHKNGTIGPMANVFRYRVYTTRALNIIKELNTVDVPRMERKWGKVKY